MTCSIAGLPSPPVFSSSPLRFRSTREGGARPASPPSFRLSLQLTSPHACLSHLSFSSLFANDAGTGRSQLRTHLSHRQAPTGNRRKLPSNTLPESGVKRAKHARANMRSRDDAKERATVEENGGETTARRSQRAAANTDNPLNLTVSQLQAQARELSMLRYKHAAQSKPATKRKKTARRRLDGGGNDEDTESEEEMPPPPLPPPPAQPTHRKALLPPSRFRGEM